MVAEARSGGSSLTPGQEKQVAFWTEFGQIIEEQGSKWKAPKPQPSSWMGYGIGRSGFGLYPTISVNADWAAVRVAMNNSDALAFFHLLQEQRASIEDALEFPLEWHEKPGRKECAVEVRRTGKLSQVAERRKLIRWMLETMDALDRVMRPRIKALDAADWTPVGTEEP